jgi:thiamine-phosphate pyrophosphorylase
MNISMNLPRVYPIIDSGLLARRGLSMFAVSEALVSAGARMLQLRCKEHFSRDIFGEAEKIRDLCRAESALLIVNDRADMALLLDAGLHLGQEDLPPSQARRIMGPRRTIGFSTHNEAQLAAADLESADYLAIGPIFATTNKTNPDPVVGTAELSRLRESTRKPLVAIGGITRANAQQVWRAGADSVAVIGDMYPEECTAASIKHRFEEWAQAAANE